MMGCIKLSVVIMFFCAVKCSAMSYNELEDFEEYLTKTSQLTPSLKQGTGDFDEYDEEDLVSDNAWEESGKFEGDLVLNERQRRMILQNVADQGLARNGIIDAAKRWPDNEVIFAIQVEHFSGDQIQAILDGIDELARVSCVKFRPYREGDRDAVVIQGNRRGCFSQVGYQGGFQALNLYSRHPVGRGCFRHGTVVHELLHSLGFYHMQSSPDRDDYVDIIWDNILKSSKHNFRKYNTFSVSDYGVGYDYDSVLHYSRQAFSVNGMDTIVPKQMGAEIGQRIGLSEKDTQKLNKMYCDADLDNLQFVGDSTEKSKKKNGKNKPFDGHGLGYNKGTAVVFKVSPEAETYKLSDVSSPHMFDYYSKPQQILSKAQNKDFRTGKKIEYTYKAPAPLIMQEYKKPVNYATGPEKLRKKDINVQMQYLPLEIRNMNTANIGKPNKVNNNADVKADSIRDTHDDEENPELIEAFDRLTKIIKSHVYPSQTSDLNIYKINDPYSKLKDDEKVEMGRDYFSSEYIRDPEFQGKKGKPVVNVYYHLEPVISKNGYYKHKPVDNNSKNKYENAPSYKRYPIEEYDQPRIWGQDVKKSLSSYDGFYQPFTPEKDSESFADYSTNGSKGDISDHDSVNIYY